MAMIDTITIIANNFGYEKHNNNNFDLFGFGTYLM